MGLRLKGQESGHCFFVTTTYKDWKRLGELPGFQQAVADSLNHTIIKYNARAIAYCLMPDHLHALIAVDGKSLAPLMRDFKKYVAQKVATEFGLSGPIWMPRYDRVAITSETAFRTKLKYIHQNPVKAGLVDMARDYEWSSASDYEGREDGPVMIWKDW